MEGRMRGGYNGRDNINVIKQLQSREICSKPHRAFASATASHRFRSMRLVHQYDAYDSLRIQSFFEYFLPDRDRADFWMDRAEVVQIVTAKNLVFALYRSGLCAAFSRETNETICPLNVDPNEVIRKLFYNKCKDSLIKVSIYPSGPSNTMKCRSTKIEYIRSGHPNDGYTLFQSLKMPGSVEFDKVNEKVLTYSEPECTYKVYDLKTYNMLYSISDRNVRVTLISPGIMLLIYNRIRGHNPLKIISIEDATILRVFSHQFHRNKKVEFLVQINEKVLLKEENENLQILDVLSSELIEVSRMVFMTPSAFICLYKNQSVLTFRNRTFSVWNIRGELITSFEDHQLWDQKCNWNNTYVTSDEDFMMSYCTAGSINVSNIFTGKCVAKITLLSSSAEADACRSSGCSCQLTSLDVRAFRDITAISYDEDRNEIFTGNKRGVVNVWSN